MQKLDSYGNPISDTIVVVPGATSAGPGTVVVTEDVQKSAPPANVTGEVYSYSDQTKVVYGSGASSSVTTPLTIPAARGETENETSTWDGTTLSCSADAHPH